MKAKVTFNKTGKGKNNYSGRVTIPSAILSAIGITQEDREVEITLEEGNKILIQKL